MNRSSSLLTTENHCSCSGEDPELDFRDFIQSWTLGRGHNYLFHVKSFLTRLFAIGNIAVLEGYGTPSPLHPPLLLLVNHFSKVSFLFFSILSKEPFFLADANSKVSVLSKWNKVRHHYPKFRISFLIDFLQL